MFSTLKIDSAIMVPDKVTSWEKKKTKQNLIHKHLTTKFARIFFELRWIEHCRSKYHIVSECRKNDAELSKELKCV